MRRMMIVALALTMLPLAAWAQRGRDYRTTLNFPVRKLTDKNKAKAAAELEKIAGVDEAICIIDEKKKKLQIDVKLISEGKLKLSELMRALKKAKVYVVVPLLKVKHPTFFYLVKPMKGVVKKSPTSKAAKLEANIKKVDGVASLQWINPTTFKLGMDRFTSLETVQKHVGRQAGTVKDMSWIGEKLTPAEQRRMQKKKPKKGDKGK